MAEVLLDPLADLRAPSPGWSCRWCRGTRGWVVLDLGEQPASDDFPLVTDAGPDRTYPLRMVMCAGCRLSQLEDDGPGPETPRGIEPAALVAQGRAAVADLAAAGLIPPGARVAEFPSPHGGSWLPLITAAGHDVVVTSERADLVVDSLGLMHAADQRAALTDRARRLAPGGVLALHVHPLETILRLGTWNALRHGHAAYYATSVLVAMAAELGLVPVGAWRYSLYGGTCVLAFASGGSGGTVATAGAGAASSPQAVAALGSAVDESTRALSSYLRSVRRSRVAAYGAASRAVALLAHAGLGPADVLAVGDASPDKWGRAMPGSRVPITSPDGLVALGPERVLLFVPDLLDEARAALPAIEVSGARWVLVDGDVREQESVR